MDENKINDEGERIFAGLFGLLLLALMAVRLWRWFLGVGFHQSVWGAIAGRPGVRGLASWDCGLWELFPDGRLAAWAMIVIIVSLIAGALLNWRRLYFITGGVFLSGFVVNAYLMVKLLMEAY